MKILREIALYLREGRRFLRELRKGMRDDRKAGVRHPRNLGDMPAMPTGAIPGAALPSTGDAQFDAQIAEVQGNIAQFDAFVAKNGPLPPVERPGPT